PGPEFPAVGGCLRVHVGQRFPVACLLAAAVGGEPPPHHLLHLLTRERGHHSSSMLRAWVGQNLTAASTSLRRLSDGVSSSTSTWPALGTSKTPGASDSHTAWPWQRSRSTRIRITPLLGAGGSGPGTAAAAAPPSSNGRCGSCRSAGPA